MSYHYSKKTRLDFEKAVTKVTDELKKEGFGVLTSIDVKETLKKKIDVDFRRYMILGACNPQFAYKALLAEDKVGTMLPCNVIVQEKDDGVEVSAVDPISSMKSIENRSLAGIANEIQAKLKRVIDNI